MRYRLSIIVIVVLALSASIEAQLPVEMGGHHGRGSVQGTVRYLNGRGLSDARVELHNMMTGALAGAVYSDPAGNFEFDNVASGQYEVVAISGLNQTAQQVEVQGMPVTTNLTLAGDTPKNGNGQTVSVAEMMVPKKARKACDKAKEAMRKQELDKARKYVNEALLDYSKYADALTLRAILELDAKDLKSARADLDAAIQADSSFATSYIALGALYNTEGKYDDAAREIDRGITLSPASWQGHFEMARALLGMGKYQPSVEQLDRAQALMPSEFPPIHLVRAHALLGLQNYSDAMNELQAFLDHSPKGADADQAQQMLNQVRAFVAAKK